MSGDRPGRRSRTGARITAPTVPTRPLVRWYGGKWKMAHKIIAHFPEHRVYVEPFGGGGSVLLRKPPAYAEIYNDLDGEIVNVFRVLRDEALAPQLIRALELTPFARAELAAAYDLTDEPVERARRLIVLAYQGFGSNAHARVPTGFRANSSRSGTTPALDWRNYPDNLPLIIDRLRGVVIECRDACETMAAHDAPATLHYVDPPYVHSTRGTGNPYDVAYRGYAVEMTDVEHQALLAFLRTLAGMVVLSGYPTALYDDALSDWHRVEFQAFADGARERTEVLWLNPACWERLGAERRRALGERQTDFAFEVSP